MNSKKLRVRWSVLYGFTRVFLSARAMRGDPFARFVMGQGRWGDLQYIEQIRREGRVVRSPGFSVTADHEICRAILRDNRFITAPATKVPRLLSKLVSSTDPGLANPLEPPSMLAVDPPDHTRYRSLVARSFTPRAMDKLTGHVAEVTDELLDRLGDNPQPDLVTHFAEQLPVAVIAEILGLPAGAHSVLLGAGHKAVHLLDAGVKWGTFREAIDGLRGFDSYLREHFDRVRAAEPGDTPFDRLATGGDMTYQEIAANASVLLGAGFETTVNLIGNGIVLLLEHPDQLHRLLDNPNLWPGAVDEILRISSPVQLTARVAGSDIEIAGHQIPKGQLVSLLLNGANRDPQVFNNPNTFDIERPNAREHLAFGSGIHACIGAALARIEGVTALQKLFERYPNLTLRQPPKPRPTVTLHGYQNIPALLNNTIMHQGIAG